jgi:broad specificity phosphatase PhoE
MMMSPILTLVCNASTKAVRGVAFPLDEPIDQQGHAKTLALASRLRRVDVSWTSPALRAKQTAAALGLNAAIDTALRDIDFGDWGGRSLTEIEAAAPDAVSRWVTDSSAAPHGGESITELLQRISAWLDIVAKTDGRVLAVTHAAVIRAAIILALDANPVSFWRIDVAPLCRVRLRSNSARWTLLSMES